MRLRSLRLLPGPWNLYAWRLLWLLRLPGRPGLRRLRLRGLLRHRLPGNWWLSGHRRPPRGWLCRRREHLPSRQLGRDAPFRSTGTLAPMILLCPVLSFFPVGHAGFSPVPDNSRNVPRASILIYSRKRAPFPYLLERRHGLSPSPDYGRIKIMNIESRIRGFLSDCGVDLVGFTSAEPFSDWDVAYRARLDNGRLPSHYSTRLSRDPRGFVPEARSIVVFGFPCDGLAEVSDPGRASIAGIAWARRKERSLSSSLARFLVDSGFEAKDVTGIPAKSAAVRAGLAVQRKNSLAYFDGTPGSAVRIGTVVTDLELPAGDQAEFEPCGDCTLCLDSCPTGALVDEFVVDTPRCLCYVLEHDSELPAGMRPALSNRLAGCETCQVVCPHNSDVPRLSLEDVPWLDMLSLAGEAVEHPDALLSLLRDEMTLPVYSDYTVFRAIAIALGNWGDPRAVPPLRGLEASRMPLVAEAARWSLDRIVRP